MCPRIFLPLEGLDRRLAESRIVKNGLILIENAQKTVVASNVNSYKKTVLLRQNMEVSLYIYVIRLIMFEK